MKSTLISVDVKAYPPIREEYVGTIFRGWLGATLHCHDHRSCVNDCPYQNNCSYYMVFKEKQDIKPYSILAFKAGDLIRGFIKVHGTKQRHVPEIVSRINDHFCALHFNGREYEIEEITVQRKESEPLEWGSKMRIQSLSPIYLEKNERMEILPEFSHFLSACIRAYNRITKYYDREVYPYRASPEVLTAHAPILDYDIKTVEIRHTSMAKRKIALKGISGSILYDTSTVPAEAAQILEIGSYVQIGKHTTYGFGGFMVKNEA